MHFQLHNEDDVTNNNENDYFLCSCLSHLMMMIMYITSCTMPLLNIADAIHCNTHAQINNT
jgi:hypothetical protein